MNGQEIRRWLCEDLTGRMDLITANTYTDNGADKYLKAGQRFLDRLFDFPHGFASHFFRVAADAWYVKFTDCRSVKEVYANDDEGRSKLTKKDRIWLMDKYTSTIDDTDTGSPLYWALAELRGINSRVKDELASFFRFIVPNEKKFNGVIFLPPPDEAMVIEVYGQFYSDWFKDDEDSTWWSEHHPELLVWAGAYMLEISYRNRMGAQDWLDSIHFHAQQIDFDTIATEIAQLDQIQG